LTAQQRRHLAEERAGHPRRDNIWVALRLGQEITPERLDAAIQRTARNHGALHAAFRDLTVEGGLVPATDAIPSLDVRGIPDSAVAATLAAHRDTTFDRTRRLWHVALLVTESRDRILSLVLDGLIADGVSAGVVLRALMSPAEEAIRSGRDYADFARWQAVRYADCTSDETAFWRATLGGVAVNRPVALPFCLDPRATPSGWVDTHSLDLSMTTAQAIAKSAEATGTTTFLVLVSALFRWVAECTGEHDVGIRVRVHGRPPTFARTVGLFADDIVLRLAHVADDLGDVIRQVQEQWVGIARNQLYPYERLMTCVEPDRLIRDHRPVEITVNAPTLPRAGGGLTADALPYRQRGPGDVAGLAFTLAARRDGVRVSVTYDVARFASGDVEAALARYAATLRLGIS
jgi:hypothetical protein